MTNGARHGLGILIGFVLTPLIGGGLLFGVNQMERRSRHLVAFSFPADGGVWAGAAMLALVAVLMGVAVGSRLSPLASLVPGFFLTLHGFLWLVVPRFAADHLDALGRFRATQFTLGLYGLTLLLGLLLLAGSAPPARWRARTAPPARGPYGPPPARSSQYPPQPSAPGPPPFPGAPPPRYGHQQPGPGSAPAPLQAPPPGQPDRPAPRAAEPDRPPRAPEPGEDAGEWTRMYGGGKDRGIPGG